MFRFMLVFAYFTAISRVVEAVAWKQVIIAAGNFSLDGKQVNIAQYDMKTNEWSSATTEFFYYDSIYNGIVWDILVNSTHLPNDVYIVGSFDTVSRATQENLCSVANYSLGSMDRVASGLCSSGTSVSASTVVPHVGVLGSEGAMFVAGDFKTRLWDPYNYGYLEVEDVARYDADKISWIGLQGGKLGSTGTVESSVQSLAWNSDDNVLYIGGQFDLVDTTGISCGLAMWSETGGLRGLPTAGATNSSGGVDNSAVTNLVYESRSKSLFVAGTFSRVDGEDCASLAVWSIASNAWRCLYSAKYHIEVPSALILSGSYLYLAGQTATRSSWAYPSSPYAIARVNVQVFIDQHEVLPVNGSSTRSRRLGERHRLLLGRPSPTAQPSSLPSSPWVAQWEWLAYFKGTNGPIASLSPGQGDLETCIFIAGSYSNYPATTFWCDGTSQAPQSIGKASSKCTISLCSLIGNHTITGLVSSIRTAVFVDYSAVVPTPKPVKKPSKDSTMQTGILILSCCILIGISIGVVLVLCGNLDSPAVVEVDGSRLLGSGEDVVARGISLTLLDNRGGALPEDFKECFERAMQARHIQSSVNSLCMINSAEITMHTTIGEGSFGRVWSGTWNYSPVAVKEFPFAQTAVAGGSLMQRTIIEEIVGEAGIMSCLRHPKILMLYGCSITPQALWIVSELCICGSLRSVLVKPTISLSMGKRLSILMDVADGMEYLHARSPSIIHRDLKSHNIFLTESSPGHYVAKIGDWGSARGVQKSGVKSMTQGVGTACWLAPEVINNAHFSKQSDVYAYGIILWEVFTRQEVYEGLTSAQIIAKVSHEELRPNVPRECPWAQIMTDCWNRNVNQRPDFKNILVALNQLKVRLAANPLASAQSQEFHLSDLDTPRVSPIKDTADPTAGDAATNLVSPARRLVNPATAFQPNERSRLLDYPATSREFHPSVDAGDFHFGYRPHSSVASSPASPGVPLIPSRRIDYASDPHNFRPPPPRATTSTARVIPNPQPAFIPATDEGTGDASPVPGQEVSDPLLTKK